MLLAYNNTHTGVFTSEAFGGTRNPLCCPGLVNTFLFTSRTDEDEDSLESDQVCYVAGVLAGQMCRL